MHWIILQAPFFRDLFRADCSLPVRAGTPWAATTSLSAVTVATTWSPNST